jgi:hypothetical protein
VQKQLVRAIEWRDALSGSSGESWANELVVGFERDVEFHKRRDAESDLHFT